MISRFYQRQSRLIIACLIVTLVAVSPIADSIPANNNTECWLSDSNDARQLYDDFRYHFGGEELILIGLEREQHSEEFIESLASRLERLGPIRNVWTARRLSQLMTEFGVDRAELPERLERIAVSRDGHLTAVVAVLTPEGLKDREGTMRQVDQVFDYCELKRSDVAMTGAPVIVAELDRLGGKEANRQYFLVTLALCIVVLYSILRQIVPSLLILASTIWAFQVTLAIVHLCGGEMNFILDSLPVMVMVFTMAIAIHYLYHYAHHLTGPDPVGTTLRSVSWPCLLATFTTAIGLASLATNSIPPVRQFGIATAGGTLAAFVAGLGITPAILLRYPPEKFQPGCWANRFADLADALYRRRVVVTASMIAFIVTCATGLYWFRAEFQPLKFFPGDSKVLTDANVIQDEFSSTDSVEVVVDFGSQKLEDAKKIEIIRDIERELRACDHVPTVISATTWLPDPLPQNLKTLAAIKSQSAENDFIADGGHLWRVSARIQPTDSDSEYEIFTSISSTMTQLAQRHDVDVWCTGIAPLVERAQFDIFHGFWRSVLVAFVLISIVMMACLRSPVAGTIAMLPNITPILVVFGGLGWLDIATNIGTMMTGSIALGIAVDGTFHFLTRYRRAFAESGDTRSATRIALIQTGPPIVQASAVTGIGMLALCLSNFIPTFSFGLLMFTSLFVAVIGDLILLPCLLYLRPGKPSAPTTSAETLAKSPSSVPHPHFLSANQHAEPKRKQQSGG